MLIHIVQAGESIETIAQMYSIPMDELIRNNGLTSLQLAVGQAIVIAYPEQVYTVQEGDTLAGIAESHNTTLIQLLRNNPYLSDRENIYPGETLVISYDNNKGKLTTNGYANSYINMDTLRSTLPFLTYLSIFGYRINATGEITDINDREIIRTAKSYGVAPIMMVSTLSEQGVGDVDTAYRLLYDKDIQNTMINNTIRILRTKGYYGVNLSYLFLNESTREAYEELTENIVNRLKNEGYTLSITISPLLTIENNKIVYAQLDYTKFGELADNIMVMNYNWGYYYWPPAPIASVSSIREFLDYLTTQIPGDKLSIGIPLLGYLWELPYVIGISKANSLTIDSAITLAKDIGVVIQFDEVSQTPYYTFTDERSGVPRQYSVWFIDVRSVDAFTKLVPEYGLAGIGLWNIMYFASRIWLVINSQYQIETILPPT
jgi:spore germination protein